MGGKEEAEEEESVDGGGRGGLCNGRWRRAMKEEDGRSKNDSNGRTDDSHDHGNHDDATNENSRQSG